MTITVHTMPGCMPCKATRRHLDRAGVTYTLIDLTQDDAAADRVAELGHTSAPVVTVELPDGIDHWDGYRPDRLDALTYLAKGA